MEATQSLSKKPKLGGAVLYAGEHCASGPVECALDFLGVDAVDVVKLSKEDRQSEWFKAINPQGTVPTFVDKEGDATCESLAIMLKLLDEFDTEHKLLAPAGSKGRYKSIEVASFAVAHIYTALCLKMVKGCEEKAKSDLNGVLRDHVAFLLKEKSTYLFGEELNMADLFLAYNLMGCLFSAEKYMMDIPEIKAYVEACMLLPCHRKVYKLDHD
eukprot:CAMPEP_0184524842 /NCGR_PEP_ID=MMETSP0198_2-20121128/9755_1 /TAXON_ID=1112570 /ORGANISM="Thraustochytrium sp., Strain LLF1b" /LENGTH=213 /DNA_ID=CAMNT_0026916211 /DNA_START=157 /DNA_END=798 /DNA_ORIENTATION=-